MTTLKLALHDACTEVASEFPDWRFVSGEFKRHPLDGTSISIVPGFYIRDGNTPLQPSLVVRHAKSMSMFKKLFNYSQPTSIVIFQQIAQLLCHLPEELRLGGWIFSDRALQTKRAPPNDPARLVDITEVKPVLRAMVSDGIGLIDKLYDFSSEKLLLSSLPPKYATRHVNSPYDEFERQKGVMVCVIHAYLGDFAFVEHYMSDEYKTVFPKRMTELNKLLAVLPTLKPGGFV